MKQIDKNTVKAENQLKRSDKISYSNFALIQVRSLNYDYFYILRRFSGFIQKSPKHEREVLSHPQFWARKQKRQHQLQVPDLSYRELRPEVSLC